MNEHPESHLSAYVDDALAPAERAAVQAHVEGCARCAAHVAELRATSRLIAALPALAPRRSLVPRLDRAPVWLRPVRLLGTIGTGAFAFLFLASFVLNTGSSLGGGTTTAERLASKGQFGAAVNALASDAAEKRGANTALPAFAPVAGGAPLPAASTALQDSARSTAGTAPPSPVARQDAASPSAAAFSAVETYSPRQVGPPAQLFLGLALLCAVAALVAHRRLRRT
jgi:anti-sigma factor RsiW